MKFFKNIKFLNFFSRFKKVHTPTILQMETTECGAAALGIISAYYNQYIPLEELRTICGVSRDGSNALQIIKGAEQIGFSASGFRFEIADLYSLKTPYIVFWNFNHFVVVEQLGKKEVRINDPAAGHRKILLEDFSKSFTGIVVTVEKNENFRKGKNPPSYFDSFKKFFRKALSPLLGVCLATFCLLVPNFTLPVFSLIFFDQLSINPLAFPWFFPVLFLVFLSSFGITYLQRYLLILLNAKLSILLTSRFFHHLLRLPIRFFSQRYEGEISNRIQIADNVAESLTLKLVLSLVNLVFVVLYLLIMVKINFLITLITFLAGFTSLLFLYFVSQSRRDNYAENQLDFGKSVGLGFGGIKNIETLKSFGMESDFFEKWIGHFTKASLSLQKVNLKDVLLTTVPPLMQMIALSFFLYIGAQKVMLGEMTIGIMISLQVLILNFLLPFSSFLNLAQSIQQAQTDLFRIEDVLENKKDHVFLNEKVEKRIEKIRLEGKIELENISFGFTPLSSPLIEKCSFKIDPGKSIAFVGPTGSGKTTLAKLITSIYLPWEGKILFDHHERESLPRETLVRSIASVDQNYFIFEGSFKENITLWDETIFEEDLIHAAKDACIHDNILSRPHGYNAKVLEEGRNLSGGQRLRLEIARALVRNPSILILDEATSELDSETEEKILQNIQRRGSTVVMIAHRLSTIKKCDEIIVLDHGKIVQKGSHLELKAKPGIYQELVKAQGLFA